MAMKSPLLYFTFIKWHAIYFNFANFHLLKTVFTLPLFALF